MDLFDFLVICTVCFVCIAFLAGGATELALDTFGAGFLPYRGPGWPRGVQEGEPVRFNIAAMADRAVPPIERTLAADTPAEIIDIEANAGLEANLADIGRGQVTRGSSLRDWPAPGSPSPAGSTGSGSPPPDAPQAHARR